MVEALTASDNDNFQSVSSKKSAAKKRLYIGNLVTTLESKELREKLIHLFHEQAHYKIGGADDIAIHNSSRNCHAIVSCSGNLDGIIRKLHRTQFEGRRLVVQRERKRRDYDSSSTTSKSSFGGSSWSKPNKSGFGSSSFSDPREETIRQVVTREMQQASDPVATAIASVAAIGVVSSIPPPPAGVEEAEVSVETKKEEPGDFLALSKQPLSALLSDYGEQDLNWQQVQPDDVQASSSTQDGERVQSSSKCTPSHGENQLAKHGKAPIHVEFSSFGYHHGAPSELRNGWSHAQPLPSLDCRDLEPVPHYLAWQDGLSGAVKRALLNAKGNEDSSSTSPGPRSIRMLADEYAEQVAAALVEAIEQGGHGYAMPLKMVIFVGSESGRHRSVVLCELAATSLRKKLRSNSDNRFGQPCSVGTRHRDIERQAAKKQNPSSRAKQRDLEED